MKYTVSPYKLGKSEAQSLPRKIDVFKGKTHTQKQVTIALVTAQKIQDTLYAQDILSGTVTLDDLMNDN